MDWSLRSHDSGIANGVFAERAVLLDRTKASVTAPSGALRIGPDGKLYVAFDSASDSRIAGSFATYNGKVLRFNTDATTPDDQPARIRFIRSSIHSRWRSTGNRRAARCGLSIVSASTPAA